MSRGLASANATESAKPHVRPVVFFELQFDSGTQRLHNSIGTLTWGGNDWLGAGAVAEMGPLEEGDDISPYRVWLRLNALDDAILDEAASEELYERLVTVYVGFIDDNGNLVADPDERWSGFMDNTEISLGGDFDAITLNCESELARFNQANGSLFTSEDQQALFAGDTGFQFLDQMEDAKIHWGPGGEEVDLAGGAGRSSGSNADRINRRYIGGRPRLG